MTRLATDIIGVAIRGPGLEGWDASRPILAGQRAYQPRASPAPAPAILSATERRRAGPVIRLALAVAQDAATACGLPAASLHGVFASSHGDGPVVGAILEALAAAQDGRAVSPTQFHNSVHNAPGGYWSIAHGSRTPVTCLGLHDCSAAAGLLKAAVECTVQKIPVLFCAYDHPLPPPLDVCHPTTAAFGAGLVLAPRGDHAALAQLDLAYLPDPAPDDLPPEPGLAALANGNPAGRLLKLLQVLAAGTSGHIRLAYGPGHLALDLQP